MSDSEKLDMAIKYCTLNYAGRLYEALADWESATDLIIEREKFIYDLENFERYASDPNRFFLKGTSSFNSVINVTSTIYLALF